MAQGQEPDRRVPAARRRLRGRSTRRRQAHTGVSANTVKSRLLRGRRTLASLLGKDFSEEHTHA
jgi:DNA-directed RNA polymerase specialized sigma24 family protein